MKRYCKDIDVTERELISRAVYDCLSGKYTRRDTLQLLQQYSGVPSEWLKTAIETSGKQSVQMIVETVIDGIQQELINENLSVPKIWYSEKIDTSSGKVRRIGIQNIKQQIYDYIAVYALEPALVRIGEYQCASIKGRGQIYGVRAVRRWMRNKDIKYAGKLDIRKCYESIPQDKLMGFLRKHIKNDKLLWLIDRLLQTFEGGLSIGSYLSQFLCNLYLSDLYHYMSEELYKIRRHRNGGADRVRLVRHVLFYMDDILILGTSAKDLHKAIKLIKQKCAEMGLCIKSNWLVFKTERTFVDMMGFRIYRDHITIRRRVFKRIRRAFMRAWRWVRRGVSPHLSTCKRCIAYFGFLRNSNSETFMRRYHIAKIIYICNRRVSYESKIYGNAACRKSCIA